MKLPTINEINPYPDWIDGRSAVDHFHNKTLEEVEALFRENGIYYSEYLMYMGPVAFVFYFRAALAYLKSNKSRDDSDFVSPLIGIIEFRLIGDHNDAKALSDGFDDYIEFCNHILENYDKYDLVESLYGDLKPRINNIVKVLKS